MADMKMIICKKAIISTVTPLSDNEINKREMFWINQYNSFKSGYNLTIGGEGTKKRRFSEEERILRSERMIGKGNSFYGKTHTLESRRKISLSQSLRREPKNSFYGKTHNKDWKEQRQLLYRKKKEDGWVSPNKGVPKPSEAIKSMKENMPHRKEIVVDGREYASISECSRILGLHRATIRLRLSRDDFPNYQYKRK